MKKLLTKVSGALATGIALAALSMPASALTIYYDDIVTGAVPDSPAPWLTATITDIGGGGVDVVLSSGVINPEFITSIFFSLQGSYSLSDPSTNPDLDMTTCQGRDPAGTGFWQFCIAFDPNDQWDGPDVSFSIMGLTEANFVTNGAGWISVAHVQGIQPNCSSWVGSFSGDGVRDVQPSSDGECGGGTTVPEPGTLGLLGLGLAAVGLGIGRRRRT